MLLYANYKVKTLKKPIVHESIKHIAIVGGHPVVNANAPDKCNLHSFFSNFCNLIWTLAHC